MQVRKAWRNCVRRKVSWLVSGLLLAGFAAAPTAAGPGPSLQQHLLTMIASALPLAQGHIGFEFADAVSGEVLAAQAGGELFTPASNAKLYTTALALVRLGATYQFRTVVRTSRPVSPDESAVSDLIFVGGGDPNLSGRVLPFSQTAIDSNPLSSVQKLSDQIQSRGIVMVKVDLVGDDTRYPFEPYPDGWTVDDSLWYYGAPVSALAVNDNSVRIIVRPSNSGELASVRLEPDFGYFLLMNQAVTVESRASHIQISRYPGSNELVISGSIGRLAPPWQEELGVLDPALFAAEALKSELENRGIAILGEARGLHRDLSAVPDPLRAPRLVD